MLNAKPCGRVSPLATTWTLSALPSLSRSGRATTSPFDWHATNSTPSGLTAINRPLVTFEAKTETVNPAGTVSSAGPAGQRERLEATLETMPSTFFDAVRVHPEPFEYLNERAVHETLVASPHTYLDYLDRSLADIAAGDIVVEQPSKLVFTDPGSAGDFRVMPCIVRRGSNVRKIVKIVGTNVVQKAVRDQITVGKAFCLDTAENFVTHIIEACLLSSARTGGCAAIALKQLARRRRRITVIGAGRVGCYAALYATALGGVEEVSFVDLLPERAEAAARLAADAFKSGTVFQAREHGSRIDADAVILATTAHRAVLRPVDTSAPLVISAGADTAHQHELGPEWATVADVYVDTTDGFRVGDLRAWVQDGLIRTDGAIDLVSLYREGPRPGTARRLFISTGSALFDNLTISYILDGSAPEPN